MTDLSRRIATAPADPTDAAAMRQVGEDLDHAIFVDLFAATPAATREALGLRLEAVDGATVMIARNEPSILLNRATGLGVEQPATPDTIARIRDLYDEAGIGVYFVQVHPDARPAALRGWLEDAGLLAHRRWMTFTRGRTAPPVAETDLRIAPIGPEQAAAFAAIVAEGFDFCPATHPMLAGLVGRPGWHLYGAFDGARLVGTAAMFVQGDAAVFTFGATTRAARKRGSQRALLARRIEDAIDLGCSALFVETGEAVPGDPQHSYRNIEWAGFTPAYLRDNYRPA